jgi:hypothetical protein
MSRIGVLIVLLVAQLLLPSTQTNAGETGDPPASNKAPSRPNASSSKVKPLRGEPAYTVIREAIFGDRRQLLFYLSDSRSRVALCTPALKETYELFQAALKQELKMLWDLDDNALKYGLSKREQKNVKVCIAKMEEYDDNFQTWQELSEAQDG